MPDILRGSLGVIEQFFGAELVEDNKHRSRMATVITPERIVRLPKTQREALALVLSESEDKPFTKVEDFKSWLRRSEQGAHGPTMLIGQGWPHTHWQTVDQALRVVVYFRRVIVDDPVDVLGLFSDHRPEEFRRALKRLAELRPLIAGGYIGFFPQGLIEHFTYVGDPDIAEEKAERKAEFYSYLVQDLADQGMGGKLLQWRAREGIRRYETPVLDRLAASVALGLDAMDITGDKYVLKYLGRDLTAVPTKLARCRLPRLELLSPRDLAALLSSDEVLAEVHGALDSTLKSIPDGLSREPERAARWIDERLNDEFKWSLHRLQRTLHSIPDAAKLGGAGAAVGATVLAGVVTASPALALAVGAAGAAADLTASWLYQWQRRRKDEPAMRVLTHLVQESPRQS